MSTILMVTPFPPQPDGIGAYALQEVRALRVEGHVVEVLSPGPSAAHYYLDLGRPRGVLALAKRVRAYDRVIVQFHPDFFYREPLTTASITATTMGLVAAALAARHFEVRLHEIDYRWGKRPDAVGRATRLLFRTISTVTVHTELERADVIAAFGAPPGRVQVVPHGVNFRPNTSFHRSEAKRSLQLPDGVHCFLSIGFIQPHKGFDRAVRALAHLPAGQARLDIVGGVRLDKPHYRQYVEELRELVADTPGAHLHEGLVSDELFDRWIVASDTVVLPYREIWSSGVMERAALLDRPVIATDTGGLRDQAGHHNSVTIVTDDDELIEAVATAAGAHVHAPISRPWLRPDGDLRRAIQDEIAARAITSGHRSLRPAESTQPAAPMSLQQLPLAAPPVPIANSWRGTLIKRIIRRLTAWEIDPIVHHVNSLHVAIADWCDRAEVTDQTGATATSRAIRKPGQ